MKKMKKLLSMLLAVVMVLAMAAPSFAEETDTPTVPAGSGSITISNATIGKNYGVYRLFTATRPEGNSDLIAYYATETQKNTITSYVYTFDEDGKNVTINNPFDFSNTANSDGLYSVSLNKDYENEETKVSTYLQGLLKEHDELFSQEGTLWTADEVEHTFSPLPYGYYFITSNLGAVVSITSTNPTADIIDKNQPGPSGFDKNIIIQETITEEGNTVTKETPVKDTSANFGDEVLYEVKVNTTNYKGTDPISYYYIKDELAKGLTYVADEEDSTKVKVDVYIGKEFKAELEPLSKSLYEVGEIKSLEDGSHSFMITIPWSKFKENSKEIEFPTGSSSDDGIIIRYWVKVNNGANIAEPGNKNVAKYTYNTWTPDPEEPEDPPKNPDSEKWEDQKETVVYTYALAVLKTDSDKNALSGAKFTLKNTEGKNVLLTGGTDGIYEYAGITDGDATVVISPISGKIIIKGIKALAQDAAETKPYILTEVEAPNGYNLLDKEIELKPIYKGTFSKKYKVVYTKDENGVVTKQEVTVLDEDYTGNDIGFETTDAVYLSTVVNYGGLKLPSTGGIGTTIFYAAGIILMAGAVFFVVRRKRA